ncbi:MAG TPA: hypothetical protein ENK66_09840 [Arcobacter sp.]|jgi:hypothetical protein|nr:hypothetical protein [Arcobacter sp.]
MKGLIFTISVFLLVLTSGCEKLLIQEPQLNSGHKVAYHLEGMGIAKVSYLDKNGITHTDFIGSDIDYHLALDVEIGTEVVIYVTCQSNALSATRTFSQDGRSFNNPYNVYLQQGQSFITTYTVKELP